MPEVGIVCADSSVADIDGVEAVFNEVAGDDPKVEDALRRILDAFEEVHGLRSLLDVRGTLGDLFEDDSDVGVRSSPSATTHESHTLGQVLHSLREAVDEHRDSDSFLAQDLRSFVSATGYSGSRLRRGADESALWVPVETGCQTQLSIISIRIINTLQNTTSILLKFATECPKRMGASGCWSPVVHVQRPGRDIQNGFPWRAG